MGRKSIFEKMGELDLKHEITILRRLLTSKAISLNGYRTIEEDVNYWNYIPSWKNNYRCINCNDIRNKLNIYYIETNVYPEVEDILTYLEYIANMMYLIERDTTRTKILNLDYHTLKRNINSLVADLNHEIKLIESEERILIVELNPTATAVADIVDEDLGIKIIRYNHYLMKGELEIKRDVLLSLADKFESIKSELKNYSQTAVVDKAGFLLNNMNIRHNNLEGTEKKEFTANMSGEELEEWYDTTYDVLLLAILTHDYIKNVKPKIENLQDHY